MALVRKGSPRIVVDGTVYRWLLRGTPTCCQGLDWSPCMYAVEWMRHRLSHLSVPVDLIEEPAASEPVASAVTLPVPPELMLPPLAMEPEPVARTDALRKR